MHSVYVSQDATCKLAVWREMACRSLPGDLAGRGEPGVEESRDEETWKLKVYGGKKIATTTLHKFAAVITVIE